MNISCKTNKICLLWSLSYLFPSLFNALNSFDFNLHIKYTSLFCIKAFSHLSISQLTYLKCRLDLYKSLNEKTFKSANRKIKLSKMSLKLKKSLGQVTNHWVLTFYID